jgi:hypothetical protein
VLGDLERVLHAYVARLRSDPATPSAHAATEAQVEDHLASFLADLAGTFHHLDAAGPGGGPPDAEPAAAVRDSTAIQRVVPSGTGCSGRGSGGRSRSCTASSRSCARSSPPPCAAGRPPRSAARRPPRVPARPSARSRRCTRSSPVAERLSVASFRRAADSRAAAEGAPPA